MQVPVAPRGPKRRSSRGTGIGAASGRGRFGFCRTLGAALFALVLVPDPAASAALRDREAWHDLNCAPAAAGSLRAPDYYAFPLVSTQQTRGTAQGGHVALYFGVSPFGVDLSEDGSYEQCLKVTAPALPAPGEGREYVVWVATPTLDRTARIGRVGEEGTALGTVRWNKFLVIVTLEPVGVGEPSVEGPAGGDSRWTGPIVMRGRARSGMMHSLIGHDPFNPEENRRRLDFH